MAKVEDASDFCIPCKIIIDNGNAAIQAIGCMQASVMLGAVNGMKPPEELMKDFLDQANAMARSAQAIARHYDPKRSERREDDDTGEIPNY